MIAFVCPKCLTTLKAPEDEAGTRTECHHCGRPVWVPGRPVSDAPAPDVLPVEAPAGRRGFPLWVLAVILPAGFLFLCCGGVGFVVYVFSVGQDGGAKREAVAGRGDMTLAAYLVQRPGRPSCWKRSSQA
jgi:hypothetical protein